MHPGPIKATHFDRYWNAEPLILLPSDTTIVPETEYRGIIYRIFPVEGAISQPIYRGTVIVIGGQDQPEIKYIATVRRSYGITSSLVQLNAYTKDRRLFRADHSHWPTILLQVPNAACSLELPPSLVPYYADILRVVYLQDADPIEDLWKATRRFFKRILPTRTTVNTPSLPL